MDGSGGGVAEAAAVTADKGEKCGGDDGVGSGGGPPRGPSTQAPAVAIWALKMARLPGSGAARPAAPWAQGDVWAGHHSRGRGNGGGLASGEAGVKRSGRSRW